MPGRTKKKEVIGDRTRTTKTKKSGKTVVKDKYLSASTNWLRT